MSPILDIKLDITLDEDENGKKITHYFPGDTVHGKIHLTSNQNYTLRNFRLAWTGRIQVQPVQSNKDSRIYFDECWKLCTISKSTKKLTYLTELVPITTTKIKEPTLDLVKHKTVVLLFQVHVPNDRLLPSCTEMMPGSPNKILYLLEAFIDASTTFFAQKIVPVYESISARSQALSQPQRKEQVFMVSLLSEEQKEFTSAMRVTLPCRGTQPGVALPVSISIWNNLEFSRKQGISISLYRIHQVLSNGRAYTSQGERVHRVVTDLNITSDEQNGHQKVQTVRVSIPIPRGTLPTIEFASSQLLSIHYFIRVQIFAQEGVYTTSEGKKSQFMMLDIPFIIGTHSRPDMTSPTPSHATLQSNPSSILRTSSTASSVKSNDSSSDGKKKMKNVFSSLRLYNKKKEGVSPAVIMTPKKDREEDESTTYTGGSRLSGSTTFSGGVFNLFPDDDDDDDIEEVIEHGQLLRRKTVKQPNKKPTTPVFKLFPDDDDDDDDDKPEPQTSAVFHLFEDDDDDDSEDDTNQLQISQRQETSVDERVKPHQQRFEKPNKKLTIVDTKASSSSLFTPNTFDSSTDEEYDEFDLLGMMARNEYNNKVV